MLGISMHGCCSICAQRILAWATTVRAEKRVTWMQRLVYTGQVRTVLNVFVLDGWMLLNRAAAAGKPILSPVLVVVVVVLPRLAYYHRHRHRHPRRRNNCLLTRVFAAAAVQPGCFLLRRLLRRPRKLQTPAPLLRCPRRIS